MQVFPSGYVLIYHASTGTVVYPVFHKSCHMKLVFLRESENQYQNEAKGVYWVMLLYSNEIKDTFFVSRSILDSNYFGVKT